MVSRLSTGRKNHLANLGHRLVLGAVLTASLWFSATTPAAAQSVADYFQLSYQPVTFSQTEIHGSEPFYATIAGSATCTKDLPVSVAAATIVSRVVAQHAQNGTTVTLNPSYTVTVEPFPSRTGDIAEISQDVPLQFPAEAESGKYNISGVLVQARIKITLTWLDVTEYLPQNSPMGTLQYTAPEPVAGNTTTPLETPVPSAPSVPAPIPDITPEAALPQYTVPWWVWLIVAAAVTTTVVNLVWFLRHRPY